MNEEPKSGGDWSGTVALAIVCITVVAIVWILWG